MSWRKNKKNRKQSILKELQNLSTNSLAKNFKWSTKNIITTPHRKCSFSQLLTRR